MPTTLLAPGDDATNEVLERANRAWLTDHEPRDRRRPRLPRRRPGAAMWLASQDRRGGDVGLVVRWPGDGRVSRARTAAELVAVAARLPVDLLVVVTDADPRPAVDVAGRFVAATGHRAAVGRPDELDGMLDGVTGVQVIAPQAPTHPHQRLPVPTRSRWKESTDRSWPVGPHTHALTAARHR